MFNIRFIGIGILILFTYLFQAYLKLIQDLNTISYIPLFQLILIINILIFTASKTSYFPALFISLYHLSNYLFSFPNHYLIKIIILIPKIYIIFYYLNIQIPQKNTAKTYKFHLVSDLLNTKHILSYPHQPVYQILLSIQFPIKYPQIMLNFLNQITLQYNQVPYHNSIHALDVALTFNKFMKQKKYQEILGVQNLQFGIAIMAAYAHDVGHNGFTNMYHVITNSDLAVRYNDKSVLQNFHAYTFFKTSKMKNCQIFKDWKREDYIKARKLVIGLILATDMFWHKDHQKKLTQILRTNPQQWKSEDNKYFFFQCLLHAADIGNPTKQLKLHVGWNYLIQQQFESESVLLGNLKKELRVVNTREINIKKTINFIEGLVYPFYRCIYQSNKNFEEQIENLCKNLQYWKNELEKERQNKVKNKIQ